MTEVFEFGKVKAARLDNGMISAVVLSYGATLAKLNVCGTDVCCGYDSVEEYENASGYLGATVGRYANRIANGRFSLGDREYVLAKNEKGATHIHGGDIGFDKRIFSLCAEGDSAILTYFSPDGEEGYPGNVRVTVKYRLDGMALYIGYEAVSDADTVLNLTNHSYFNLDGAGSLRVLDHTLSINAEQYDAVDERLIPVETRRVAGTPFDFRTPKKIGRDIGKDDRQLAVCGGYDHNFYLKSEEAACLTGKKLGMKVFTDMPCIQLYTANFFEDGYLLSGKKEKHNNAAVCLETQTAPDSPNRSDSALLRAGEQYRKKTVYLFFRV
ncbi:MAG TPA: aldose epimerase family protein [Bacillota bacterium]|nr:aldose epimerase family protein [Bacillota bacterium]